MRHRLILLRHGKSGYPDGVADHDRPLASRGRREVPLAGCWLAAHHPDVGLVVTSTAKRARQSAELVLREFPTPPELRSDGRLYLADDDQIMAIARALPADVTTVLFVGHNPGLEECVATTAQTWYQMRTASIAVLSGTGWNRIGPGWATLETAVTPRG